MNSPWFKFYPPDWRADQALRICCLAARGLWMEMLCLMHEALPRGSLLINGVPVTERQLASLSGCPLKEVLALLAELEAAGVFSRDGSGTIFSRRMRRDDKKAARDKLNGRGGGNPNIIGDNGGVNPPDNPQDNGGDKAHTGKPEARDQKINNIHSGKPARDPARGAPSGEEGDPRGASFGGFPPDGSIAFGPFAVIARSACRGADPDVVASAFRKFCHANDIDFKGSGIAQKFKTFCGKHKIQGLHS